MAREIIVLKKKDLVKIKNYIEASEHHEINSRIGSVKSSSKTEQLLNGSILPTLSETNFLITFAMKKARLAERDAIKIFRDLEQMKKTYL